MNVIAINKAYLSAGRTSKSDNVFTPYYAVEPLLKYLPKDKIIWCPFDEDWSAYYNLLKENGFQVVRSSLVEGQDFFTYEPEKWDIIVSNPPFSLKDKILKRLYSFNKPFAILLPMNSLQGKERYKYFKNGVELLAFDGRIDYHTNFNYNTYTKGNHFASAYFCRNILPDKLIIEDMTKYERPLKICKED